MRPYSSVYIYQEDEHISKVNRAVYIISIYTVCEVRMRLQYIDWGK